MHSNNELHPTGGHNVEECTHMSPAKNLGGGGRGLRKILGGWGVKKCHEVLQHICKNLEGWSKISKKCYFLAKFF
jgi:hypothetical protein